MVSKFDMADFLQTGRDIFYKGRVRRVVQKVGLNSVLSEPYWKLVYRLSDGSQEHTVCDQTVSFKIETYTEFMRFRDLVGERAILEDLLRSLDSEDNFYDIGANVGTYTCFAAAKLGPGQTIAFEPEPQNVARLYDNLELNDLEADVVEVALSDTNGSVDLAIAGPEAGEGKHSIDTDGEAETIKVRTARGDTILNRHELPAPSVVKIDVEGAELSVLSGLEETLREHVRLVYVEVHTEKITKFGDAGPEVRAFLEEAGFDVKRITQRRNEIFLRATK